MKTSTNVLIFSSIVLTSFLAILWLIDYSAISIPESLPRINVQTYTILIFAAIAIVLVFFQKRLLINIPGITILKLVLLSLLVCFMAQFIYQLIRQFCVLRNLENNKLNDLSISIIASSILSGVVALSIALELKKVKQVWRTLSTVLILIILLAYKEYLPKITW